MKTAKSRLTGAVLLILSIALIATGILGCIADREGTPDDLLALGEVEAAGGLEDAAQLDVGQPDEVPEALVRGVGDEDGHGMEARSRPGR